MTLPEDDFAGPRESDTSWLRTTARRMLGPKLRRWMDSTDLVQDALVEKERASPRVRNAPERARRRWLQRVMGNLAARYARRRDLQLSGSGNWSGMAGSTPRPDAASMARERADDIRQRLRHLDERAREVILMRVVDDKPFAAIAEHLSISEQNARVIFHRSIKKLREIPEA